MKFLQCLDKEELVNAYNKSCNNDELILPANADSLAKLFWWNDVHLFLNKNNYMETDIPLYMIDDYNELTNLIVKREYKNDYISNNGMHRYFLIFDSEVKNKILEYCSWDEELMKNIISNCKVNKIKEKRDK